MTRVITTTISDENWKFAKANSIKWRDCIARGIAFFRKGKDDDMDLRAELAKQKQARETMQRHIFNIQNEHDEEVKKLRERLAKLEGKEV